MNRSLAIIPFAGLYNSWHADELDTALEQAFSDLSGRPNARLQDLAFDTVDWTAAHECYAKAYASCFAAEFQIEGLEFESLQSPREYNFTTDRIFVHIPDATVATLFAKTPRELLGKVAAEHFTSRSGFISFYSPDWTTWGPASGWDHNQLMALIDAYVRSCRDGKALEQSDECDLMEAWRCNGGPDECLFANASAELKRLARVAYYLREREERAYR